MSNLKYTLLFLLFSLVSSDLFSQKIFREGYIIKKSGEEFEGLVEYSPDKDIPSICRFKRFDIAMEIIYQPADLKAFGYKNGKRFESLKIESKESFYETLVKGKLTIYRKGSKYFIQKEDNLPLELKNGNITLKETEGQKEFNNIRELLKYLTEPEKIAIKENLNIKTDLVPVAVEYNRKSGKPFSVFRRDFSEKELIRSEWLSGANRNKFGIIGGMNYYYLNLTPKSNDFIPKSSGRMNPLAGISYERVLSRRSDRFALRTEVMFLKQNFYSYSESTYGAIYRYKDDAFIDFAALRIPILFQFSIDGKRAIPFFYAGTTGTIFLTRNYDHIRETINNENTVYTTEDKKFELKKNLLCANAGGGIKFRMINKLSINLEGRFEFGPGFISKYYPGGIIFHEYSVLASLLIGITF